MTEYKHRSVAPWNRSFYYDLPRTETFTVGTTPVRVAIGDDMRVTLLFAMSGLTEIDPNANFIYVAPTNLVSVSNGIMLPKSIPIVFTSGCHGQLVNNPWYAVATTEGNLLTVVTQRMRDWPENPVGGKN